MGHAIEDLESWTDHGAVYRVLELRDGHALVQLCSCTGEPVELLEWDDPQLIAYLMEKQRVEDPS